MWQIIIVQGCISYRPSLSVLLPAALFSVQGRDVGPLLPAVQPLSRLTRLDLSMLRQLPDLQQLPGSAALKHLTVTAVTPKWQSRVQLSLGHLTAVAELQLLQPPQRYLALPDVPLALQVGDVLPPNLTQLVLGDCLVAAPLLLLQQLQELSMDCSSMPAGQLLLLARALPKLRQLQLGYTEPGSVDAAAAAWSCLPVTSLATDAVAWSSYSVQQLATLGCCLTALELMDCRPLGCTAVQLASALRQLVQLRQLSMGWVQLLGGDSCSSEAAGGEDCGCSSSCSCEDTSSCSSSICSSITGDARVSSSSSSSSGSGLEAVVAAVASLPLLRSLWLEHPLQPVDRDPAGQQLQPLNFAAVQQLSAATGLTHLTLAACGLNDELLATCLQKMTALQELVLDDNIGLSDAAAAGIGQHLRQLKYLSMNNTGLTDAGVEGLAGLKQLQGFSVAGTAVTEQALSWMAVQCHGWQCTCSRLSINSLG
jgi:hypothetical protein